MQERKVCCTSGLWTDQHFAWGGFSTCLLWVEWTPVFLQLFDLPDWSGCYRRDIAFCQQTNSQLIAGWSTNIKTLQPLYCGRWCALLFKSAQSSAPKPRAKTYELNERENLALQRNRICTPVVRLVEHIGLCFPWTDYRLMAGWRMGEKNWEQAACSGAGLYTKH